MRVLGIDTATLVVGIAIVDDEHVLAEATHDAGQRTAGLLVTIDAVCKQAGITPHQLDAVAVGAGPGSFTGLRIGMATAKGIAFAAGKPLWAVSSLAALVHDANATGVVVGVLDARRGEVFAGCYRDGALVDQERVLPPAALAPWVSSLAGAAPISFAGDAVVTYPELASLGAWSTNRTPTGRAIAHLALAGPRVNILVGGAPSYIRASEAEIMYPDGVPGALRKK